MFFPSALGFSGELAQDYQLFRKILNMGKKQKPPILIIPDNNKMTKAHLWEKWLEFLDFSKKYNQEKNEKKPNHTTGELAN